MKRVGIALLLEVPTILVVFLVSLEDIALLAPGVCLVVLLAQAALLVVLHLSVSVPHVQKGAIVRTGVRLLDNPVQAVITVLRAPLPTAHILVLLERMVTLEGCTQHLSVKIVLLVTTVLLGVAFQELVMPAHIILWLVLDSLAIVSSARRDMHVLLLV